MVRVDGNHVLKKYCYNQRVCLEGYGKQYFPYFEFLQLLTPFTCTRRLLTIKGEVNPSV